MTKRHDEISALLDRAMYMLQRWHAGKAPTPGGYNLLMADWSDYLKRWQQEQEQLKLWEGKDHAELF